MSERYEKNPTLEHPPKKTLSFSHLKKSTRIASIAPPTDPNADSIYLFISLSFAAIAGRSKQTEMTGLRIRGTWQYLSMKVSAFGTLWSPRWTTEDPTQEPREACVAWRSWAMARPTRGAGWTWEVDEREEREERKRCEFLGKKKVEEKISKKKKLPSSSPSAAPVPCP